MEYIQKEHTIKTIKSILEKLRNINPEIIWEISCNYSDGKEYTLLEIKIFRKDNKQIKGQICFREENHQVINFRYNGINNIAIKPSNIIDLLLDILNIEKDKIDKTSSDY